MLVKQLLMSLNTFSLVTQRFYVRKKTSLLCFTIDAKLNFKGHISQICTKASQQLDVLKSI